MSERPRAALTAIVLALILVGLVEPTDARAQETPLATEAELLARIEALVPQVEAARAATAAAEARAAAEQAAQPHPATRMIRVGPMRVLAPADQADLARELFGAVWREYFEGFASSPSLAAHVFTFRWSWDAGEQMHVEPAMGPVRRVELARAWAPSSDMVRLRIRDAIWEVLLQDLPEGSRLGRWLERAPYPQTLRAARRVATTSAAGGRSCLEGRDDACAALLENAERGAGTEVAASIVLEAIRLGGQGTWGRFIERAETPPLEALTATAGVDRAALLTEWRAGLLEQTPESYAGLGGRAARLAFWIVLLAACTARSTRWRFA